MSTFRIEANVYEIADAAMFTEALMAVFAEGLRTRQLKAEPHVSIAIEVSVAPIPFDRVVN